jgi:hypothetical protein
MKTQKTLRTVLAVTVATIAALGCGSDDKPPTLYKWSCNCSNACAATQAEAFTAADCATHSYCNPTGDTCVCPGGAHTCSLD